MSKEVFVFTEARAGSSLCGNILHNLGVNMGDNLKSSSPRNKRGYYEDKEVKPLARRVKEGKKTDEEYKEMAKEWVESRNDDDLWGVKMGNRKLNLAYPYIHPFLDDPHAVVTRRKLEDQVDSMKLNILNGENDTREVVDRIEKTYEIIEDQIDEYDLPSIEIQYERWFEEPEEQLQELCEFLDIECDVNALKCIDPSLHNFDTSDQIT